MSSAKIQSNRAIINDCAVLVESCDSYSDLWNPFFTLLEKYWSDVPFKIYLGTNTLEYKRKGVTVLKSKADARDWSACLASHLKQLTQTKVLIILEDFFLRKPINNDHIIYCLKFSIYKNAIQVRLIPRPKPNISIINENVVGECSLGYPLRLSTQAAIWDRLSLLDLLETGENIWQFERNANKRINRIDTGFYSTYKSILHYEGIFTHHVVEKGKWFYHEKFYYKKKNIGCDFKSRNTLSIYATFIYFIRILIDKLLNIFPWRIKLYFKNTLRNIIKKIYPNIIIN